MKTQITNHSRVLFFLMMLILGGLQALVASNQNANENASYGYCDGPDNRLCKITEQGTITYGKWVEEQPIHY